MPSVSVESQTSSGSAESSSSVHSQEYTVDVAPPVQLARYENSALSSTLPPLQPRGDRRVALSEVLQLRQAGIASLGSARHEEGSCYECLFANRAQHHGGIPCKKGILCDRCHAPHGVMARRKAKTGRQRERIKAQRQKAQAGEVAFRAHTRIILMD